MVDFSWQIFKQLSPIVHRAEALVQKLNWADTGIVFKNEIRKGVRAPNEPRCGQCGDGRYSHGNGIKKLTSRARRDADASNDKRKFTDLCEA